MNIIIFSQDGVQTQNIKRKYKVTTSYKGILVSKIKFKHQLMEFTDNGL